MKNQGTSDIRKRAEETMAVLACTRVGDWALRFGPPNSGELDAETLRDMFSFARRRAERDLEQLVQEAWGQGAHDDLLALTQQASGFAVGTLARVFARHGYGPGVDVLTVRYRKAPAESRGDIVEAAGVCGGIPSYAALRAALGIARKREEQVLLRNALTRIAARIPAVALLEGLAAGGEIEVQRSEVPAVVRALVDLVRNGAPLDFCIRAAVSLRKTTTGPDTELGATDVGVGPEKDVRLSLVLTILGAQRDARGREFVRRGFWSLPESDRAVVLDLAPPDVTDPLLSWALVSGAQTKPPTSKSGARPKPVRRDASLWALRYLARRRELTTDLKNALTTAALSTDQRVALLAAGLYVKSARAPEEVAKARNYLTRVIVVSDDAEVDRVASWLARVESYPFSVPFTGLPDRVRLAFLRSWVASDNTTCLREAAASALSSPSLPVDLARLAQQLHARLGDTHEDAALGSIAAVAGHADGSVLDLLPQDSPAWLASLLGMPDDDFGRGLGWLAASHNRVGSLAIHLKHLWDRLVQLAAVIIERAAQGAEVERLDVLLPLPPLREAMSRKLAENGALRARAHHQFADLAARVSRGLGHFPVPPAEMQQLPQAVGAPLLDLAVAARGLAATFAQALVGKIPPESEYASKLPADPSAFRSWAKMVEFEQGLLEARLAEIHELAGRILEDYLGRQIEHSFLALWHQAGQYDWLADRLATWLTELGLLPAQRGRPGDVCMFDPVHHRTVPGLAPGEPCVLVFPGLMTADGTVLRPALVARADERRG